MGEKIRIGQIINTQGIKGEVRVYPLTDYKERFEEIDIVSLEDNPNIEFHIENVKYKNQLVILKFKGFNNINEVEKFKNKFLVIDKNKLRKLPEDTYYIIDLIGLDVYESNNRYLGKLVDVIKNSAQDLYVVKIQDNSEYKDKKILIPAVKEFIQEVDLTKKIMKVKLIEGMLE